MVSAATGTWANARASCAGLGGDLITYGSMWEQVGLSLGRHMPA
jgi:hypothetical protein